LIKETAEDGEDAEDFFAGTTLVHPIKKQFILEPDSKFAIRK